MRRGGKFETVAKALPLGKALRTGTSEVKRTLAATFRLKPVGATTERDTALGVDTNEFRSFAIQKGRRVETPLQYIQRSKFRLSSRSEIGEIQTYRRAKT